MKLKLVSAALFAMLALTACNNKAGGDATTAKPTTTITEQSSEIQKVGYAVGFDMGRNLKEVADDMDLEAFQLGLKDAYAKKDSVLTEEQMQSVVQAYMTRKQEEAAKKLEEKAKTNKTDGEKFLAENAKKEGVKTTASGLQYKVITEGEGEHPKATDTVTVNYEGKLIDGKVFDSSYERGEPIEFPLNQVIPGWTEGVQLMKPGAKYEFFIPSDLAYGEAGNPDIEPNSVLIFTVELLTKEQAETARAKAAAAQEEQMKKIVEAAQKAGASDQPADAKPADASK